MSVLRIAFAVGTAAIGIGAAAPAAAQFFMKSHDFSDAPNTGTESDIGLVLPGATADEQRAALVWNMRAALNVAALQCQFEPTLLSVGNYNALLTDHKDELKSAFDTLNKYFQRTNKGARAGQNALDQFSTRTYSTYATVAAQYGFCQTTASIGRDAIFAPRGGFVDLVVARTRELRNSLTPYGEQQFPRYIGRDYATYPMLDDKCWNKKGEWQDRKCGEMTWQPIATALRRG
ncbi:MAG: hypothetical protein OSB00_05180 [Sphingomonas bacterium]|nr:hypothetical protein [Sphingomonas bacterium]